MAGNFFRGTTVEQDGRWGKSDEKLIAKLSKSGKIDAILNHSIDFKKINLDIISKWVNGRLIEILGFDDDIVSGLIINTLIHSDSVSTYYLVLLEFCIIICNAILIILIYRTYTVYL